MKKKYVFILKIKLYLLDAVSWMYIQLYNISNNHLNQIYIVHIPNNVDDLIYFRTGENYTIHPIFEPVLQKHKQCEL